MQSLYQTLDNLLDTLSTVQYLSTLDLTKG